MMRMETTDWNWRLGFSCLFASAFLLGSASGMAKDIDPLSAPSDALSGSSQTSSDATDNQPPLPKPKAKLLFGVGERSIADQLTQSDSAGVRLGIDAEKYFSTDLSGHLQLDGYFYSGAADNLLTGEGKPVNGIYLTEGALIYTPWSFLKLRAGVLGTTISTLPTSMMDLWGFPGVSEGTSYGGDLLKVSFIARQLIPNASTLGSRYLPTDTTPSLISNTVLLESKPNHGIYELQGALSYYNFSGLSQGFAQDSRFAGNSVIGLGSTDAQFAYDFEGLEAAMQGKLDITRHWILEASQAGIINVQAPLHHNRGFLSSAKLSYGQKAFRIGGGALYYYNESDTMPAAFARMDYGYTNRAGPAETVSLDLPLQKLSFFGTWAQSTVIQSTPYQSDRNLLTFGVETSYAL